MGGDHEQGRDAFELLGVAGRAIPRWGTRRPPIVRTTEVLPAPEVPNSAFLAGLDAGDDGDAALADECGFDVVGGDPQRSSSKPPACRVRVTARAIMPKESRRG